MEIFCYLCNNKTKDWSQNLKKIKSKHSGTLITDYIAQFLGDFESVRNLYDEANCLCSLCLSRIHAYDWMIVKTKEQEKVLRQVLIATETKKKEFMNAYKHVFGTDETEKKIKFEEIMEVPDSPQPKPELPDTPTKPVEPVKRSKPIIVRVVKRVPFLKTTMNATSLQPSKPPLKINASGEGPSTLKPKPKPVEKPITQKPKKATGTEIVVCDICDGKFKGIKLLGVCFLDNFELKKNTKKIFWAKKFLIIFFPFFSI